MDTAGFDHSHQTTPTPTVPPTPRYQPARPFMASVQGWTAASPQDRYAGLSEDWPNTVTVEATVRWWPTQPATGSPEEEGGYYADTYGPYGERQLVEIDTNYKPGRTGEHPVRLTRPDAITLAAHVLAAVADTDVSTRDGVS